MSGGEAEAKKQADQAMASAASAHERAQQLEHDNLVLKTQLATLEIRAAEAQQALAVVHERLADRHLTTIQKERIADALQTESPGTLSINWVSTTDDAWAYGTELASLFTDAGWTAGVSENPVILIGPAMHGLWIVTKTAHELSVDAMAVQRVFKAAGILVQVDEDPQMIGKWHLLIGPK